MSTEEATAVVAYHRTADAGEFRDFARRLGAAAAAAPGFKVWGHSILTSPWLDWSIAVTFHDESALHRWLDQVGDGLDDELHKHARVDLIVGDIPRTEGVLLAREVVKPDSEDNYVRAAEHLVMLEHTQPGYDGSSVFSSFEDPDDAEPCYRVIRFRTAEQLDAWLDSPVHHTALPELEQHLSESASFSATTAFSTLRVSGDGKTLVTPPWKTYLMVLLVLYPTAVLQAHFVDPVIRSLVSRPWLSALMSMMLNVALLVWLMMPLGARVLRRWMDPVDGSGAKVTLLGVLAIVATLVAYLAIFGLIGFIG